MAQRPKKSIEDIVEELGRYPLDAFIFVQECIGAASEQVHGPMSPEETAVGTWMEKNSIDLEQLGQLYQSDSLPPDIASAVSQIGGPEQMNRHVTGQQLCWAVRDVALKRWGFLARQVLTRWNIRHTQDIGQIVFALVNNDWLRKLPSDRIEDFNDVFSFDEALEQAYKPGWQ